MPDISLLWPHRHTAERVPRLPDSVANDLDLERTAAALSAQFGYASRIRDILLRLTTDPDTIRYRQATLSDLVKEPDLLARLEKILPRAQSLDSFAFNATRDQSPLHEVVWRIGQLEAYVDVIQGLRAALADFELRSEALRRLHDATRDLAADETFQRLVAELPEMLERVRSIASVTIGVNLDDQLRPVEATLIAINKEKFRGHSPSLFGALFGHDSDSQQGIAQLHSARASGAAHAMLSGDSDPNNPMLYPLFRDLAQVLKRVSRPIAAALQAYARVNTAFLHDLGVELAFFLGAARLTLRLRAAGLPMTQPEIVAPEARVCEIDSAYNLNLALRALARADGMTVNGAVVPSDVGFGEAGRIFVLTGPNQGGKTTYTQAVGLAQALAQAGLFVPGKRARISPVDRIFTHFPVEERPEAEAGRLGEEAKRLNDIFAQATRYSLVLLNESLASTSPSEGLYLARDIMRVLRLLGARAIFATHFHELAAGCDDLNADTPGDSQIISLVSMVNDDAEGDMRQTFRIMPGPPRGHSYAREIAARYGISYAQLEQLLRSRGVFEDDRAPR